MIGAYTGKTGSSKSFLMIKQGYKEWKHGRNIASNTMLFYDYFKAKYYRTNRQYGKIEYFQKMNDVIHMRKVLIMFDEAQVLFNARNWESLPDEFQYKLQQHRKHEVDLICTTQNMGTIDIAYRRLIHKWIHCRNMFQMGKSPKLLIGIFKTEEKDIDYLYNTVDDLTVPTVSSKIHIIHYFSRRLYDTMYDIGFNKFKIEYLCDYSKAKLRRTAFIIPKDMTMTKAMTEIRMFKSVAMLNP